MKTLLKLIILSALCLFTLAPAARAADVTDEFPELKKYLYTEPKSGFHFGFGVNPVGVAGSSLYMSADFFQLHWMKGLWDLELLNASVGYGMANSTLASSKHFLFRVAPKVRFFGFLSVGPLVGWEFVSFPNVNAQLYNNGFVTPIEPFSSNGFIYGLVLSETFDFKAGYLLKFSQAFYQQTYSVTQAYNGWQFIYQNNAIQTDPSHTAVKPSQVFLLQVSLLF